MQTTLAPEYAGTADGEEAKAILGRCVHCGFCTATCPTYQLLGDELDGPRGRIYLIKQVLEGAVPTRKTQLHLDRCLTCRNCETTCPSGVQYGNLVEIGRNIVERKVERPLSEKLLRGALKTGLTSPLFTPAMKLGKALRPLLPATLKNKVPENKPAGAWPARTHAHKVLMLTGCVQPSMMPNINAATARVLDIVGVQVMIAAKAGCCGAIKLHMNDHEGGLDDIRRNIDAWWPYVEKGEIQAIVMNASGCGATVKAYAHALQHDAAYLEKAQRISALTKDVSELLADHTEQLKSVFKKVSNETLAYHPPCTLQHGQQLKGGVEALLTSLGVDVKVAANESHLCCGSAGTYSVTQPVLAYQLRDRKLQALAPLNAQRIISSNIGCIQHLQTGSDKPVEHWIEWLDRNMTAL
jgi:glycolate oxidase iron-sulfur subunit